MSLRASRTPPAYRVEAAAVHPCCCRTSNRRAGKAARPSRAPGLRTLAWRCQIVSTWDPLTDSLVPEAWAHGRFGARGEVSARRGKRLVSARSKPEFVA